MKNLLSLIVLATLFVSLIGCPYDSKVGLNTYEESQKLNKKFYGEYTNFKDDGTKDLIQITKGMKQVYNIRHHTIDEKGQKMEYYYHRGFITEISGVKIVNVEKKDGMYNFYKFEWKSDDELVLYPVGEEYVKANYTKAGADDTETLRTFIEAHLDKGLFEEGMVFARDGSEAYKALKDKD
ncbi:hypothetical protein JYT14_00205 [Flavobacteriales bacterium AH-315-E23]|nr:hypothetical protein [Flavobacteriales bacterium AH-315-E23]